MSNDHETLLTTTEGVRRHQICSAPFVVDNAPFRSYWEHPSEYTVEEVCAALARVEKILRCLGYRPPNNNTQSDNSEGTRGAVDYSVDFLDNLLSLMEREPALHRYLGAHKAADESADPLAAWAAASGDVAFLQTLKERGWEPIGSRVLGLVKSLMIPGALIFLTAFLGNSIATALQREAFKHQRTFDVRLAGLQKGQDRAAELYTSINEIYSTIADFEELKYTGIKTQKLRAERQKLDSIHAAAKLYDDSGAVGEAMANAEEIIDSYIECLDKKREQEQAQPEQELLTNCSQKYEGILVAFDKILDAHTIAMNQLASRQE